MPLAKFLANEMRFRVIERANPEHAHTLQQAAQLQVQEHYHLYERLRDAMKVPTPAEKA